MELVVAPVAARGGGGDAGVRAEGRGWRRGMREPLRIVRWASVASEPAESSAGAPRPNVSLYK